MQNIGHLKTVDAKLLVVDVIIIIMIFIITNLDFFFSTQEFYPFPSQNANIISYKVNSLAISIGFLPQNSSKSLCLFYLLSLISSNNTSL